MISLPKKRPPRDGIENTEYFDYLFKKVRILKSRGCPDCGMMMDIYLLDKPSEAGYVCRPCRAFYVEVDDRLEKRGSML